jgi:hypothetical protein
MKTIVTILFLISTFSAFSQSDEVVGDYALKFEKEGNHLFEYKLSLNADGTFFFQYYSKIENRIPPEVNNFAKGTWIVENKLITFFSDKKADIDQK